MQRYARARLVLILLAGAAALVTSSAGRADEPVRAEAKPPRPLMRLPDWIESIGGHDRAAARSAPAPTAPVSSTVLAAGWKQIAEDANAKNPAPDGSVESDAAAASEKQSPSPELRVFASESGDETAGPADAKPAADARAAVATDPVPPASVPKADAGVAPVPKSPADAPALAIDPASFRGVLPGKTNRNELETNWGAGEAFIRDDGVHGLFWRMDPFERIEVTLVDDVVDSIRIKLAEPVALQQLATQMEIADVRTVSILDENGVSVGEVFPERGIVISVKPGTQTALAVLLETLDPEPFVLRAEGEIDDECAHAIADLQYAIDIDPRHVRAHRLLLALLCDQGRWNDAIGVAEAVQKLDDADVWTKFKHADVLMALGRIDEARAKIEHVRKLDNVPPLVTAQSARVLGRLELAADSPDYQKSVAHFEEAIRKATPLTTNQTKAIQRAAGKVLLDAHVGTALAIARGTWQQKGRVIPKWIARSESLVAESDAGDEERTREELALCRGALAVAASCSEGVEALPWVKRLMAVREKLGDQVQDPARRLQVDWEVGLGLADAIEAALKRGDASDILENATLTVAYLERGAEQRQLTDAERRSLGDLMFRIGILHSLQNGAHATAVTWFDKVVPLWENNSSFVKRGDVGRLGESFISMAISYWQVDRRDDALRLSRTGVDLMVAAVDLKQIEERSLAVAYGNLSTMYAEQGNDEQSRAYAEMASRAETAETRVR